MSIAIATVVTLTVLGMPLTLLLDRRATRSELAGLAFLYGTALTFAVLLTLSILGVPWTLPLVLASQLAIATTAAIAVRSIPDQSSILNPQSSIPARAIDAATAIVVVIYALFVTAAPLRAWDFWAIWGLKGRVFLEHGGIDWRFLESPWNEFAHRDYPLLLPLNLSFAGMMSGGWDDRWLGLLFVAFGAALLLIVRAHAARELPAPYAAAIALATTPFALPPDAGLAEGPFIAFAAAALLTIRRALSDDDHAALRRGALLLGFAASCKNEGLALIAAVALALVVIDRRAWRRVLQLWPALLVVAPWKLLAAMHSLSVDFALGDAGARLMQRLGAADAIAAALLSALADRWLWLALFAGLLLVPAGERRRERFVLLVTAIQVVFYVAAYFVTPHDALWHIATSWHRLTRQLGAPVVFVTLVLLSRFAIGRGEDSPAQPS